MPTLTTSLNINSSAADNSTLTTSSFTPTTGDVIVIKAAKENASGSAPILGPVSDSQGNTYTLRASYTTFGSAPVWIWTTFASASSSMTVSMQTMNVSGWRSMTVEDWTSANLDASPATATANGSGSPSASLTTTQNNSAVTWVNADFAAVSPSGRTYDSTSAVPVEDGLHDKSGVTAYVAYYAWQSAASAGSQTLGLTSPTGQAWAMVALEILDIPGPSAPEDSNQAEPIILWQ